MTLASPRILIIKLGALGDAIMASAIIPAIRQLTPTAHVTWVAGRRIRALVERFEGVDATIEVDEDALLLGTSVARTAELVRCWRRIGRGYDRAIIAHADWRYAVLARWSGASDVRRARLGRKTSTAHWHGDIYALLAGPASVDGPVRRHARYAAVRDESPDVPHGVPGFPVVPAQGPLVVIAPGGARNPLRDDALRRWPIERWVALTMRLVAGGARVVAVGGFEDSAETSRCAGAGAHDLGGATDLLSLLRLIGTADAVVTHDSGVLHLALLAQKPVVALFGPTPSAHFVPPGAKATVLSSGSGLSCAPCYNGVDYARCSRNACVADVEVATVERAVHDYLTAGQTSRASATDAARFA